MSADFQWSMGGRESLGDPEAVHTLLEIVSGTRMRRNVPACTKAKAKVPAVTVMEPIISIARTPQAIRGLVDEGIIG
ncbi:MAG: hypothetical protein AAGJ94_00750 [Pseudomonadota bacterium]